MKSLFFLAFLVTTNAYAVNICSFEETSNFDEALGEQGIRPSKISKNHKRFTFVEKQMIHLTVTQQNWQAGVSKEEAMELFGDYDEGKLGFNAGEIVYYRIDNKEYALVHYWPGDNEYGAFFEMKNGSYKLIANVSDSFISCK